MSRRFDTTEVSFKKEGENYKADFTAMQTGVFPYWDWDTWSIRYELKHPDDWVKEDIAKQLHYLPVTDDHPFDLLDSNNKRENIRGMCLDTHSIGTTGFDGTMLIWDSELVGKILLQDKRECSLGFECEIKDESGVYNGVHYDVRQINPRLNHIAVVDSGRCGSEASIHDAGLVGAIRVDKDFKIPEKQTKKDKETEEEKMAKVKIMDSEFDVPEAVAVELQKKVDAMQGKMDGLTVAVDKAKTEGIKEKVDAEVKKLMTCFDSAKEVLGEDYSIIGKTTRDVMVDAICKQDSAFKADGKSEDYIQGRFDTLCMSVKNDSYGDEETEETKEEHKVDTKPDGKRQTKIDKEIEDLKAKRLMMKNGGEI